MAPVVLQMCALEMIQIVITNNCFSVQLLFDNFCIFLVILINFCVFSTSVSILAVMIILSDTLDFQTCLLTNGLIYTFI